MRPDGLWTTPEEKMCSQSLCQVRHTNTQTEHTHIPIHALLKLPRCSYHRSQLIVLSQIIFLFWTGKLLIIHCKRFKALNQSICKHEFTASWVSDCPPCYSCFFFTMIVQSFRFQVKNQKAEGVFTGVQHRHVICITYEGKKWVSCSPQSQQDWFYNCIFPSSHTPPASSEEPHALSSSLWGWGCHLQS